MISANTKMSLMSAVGIYLDEHDMTRDNMT